MKPGQRAWVCGVALTALLAAAALGLARLPGVSHLGALSLALLLGLAWRAVGRVPERWEAGIAFSARRLLRVGIVLLGVRLNFALLAHVGPRILLLDTLVIVAGLGGISWLGRRFGLDPILACLIAVDSSICGGSAVAAAAPTLRAKETDVALVIPLCSLVGTGAMLGFTLWQHQSPLSPAHYGMLTGATLHEVAQVMAAVSPFPEAAEIGTVTKLTRVMLLVPAVLVLGWIFARGRARVGARASWTAERNARVRRIDDAGASQAASGRADAAEMDEPAIPKPWFVVGFLVVGLVNTLAFHFFPEHPAGVANGEFAVHVQLVAWNQHALGAANVLMALAMAGLGLQVDFARLRSHGIRVAGTALIGWLVLAGLAATQIWVMGV